MKRKKQKEDDRVKDRIIEIKHVNFRYKGSEMGLLKDMSLNVCK